MRDLSPQLHTLTPHLNHSPPASSSKFHTSQDSPAHFDLRLGLKGPWYTCIDLALPPHISSPQTMVKRFKFKNSDLYPSPAPIHYSSQGNTGGLHILKLAVCSKEVQLYQADTDVLATSWGQGPGMVRVRLLILVSEVPVHNVLSKSRGLEFPSNLTSVSFAEKASHKQNYKAYFQLSPLPLTFSAGHGSSISRDLLK